MHFLAADRAGEVAVIEFLDGERRARTGADLPVPVLTNSTYTGSLVHLGRHKGFGGESELPVVSSEGKTSLARFVVAAAGRASATEADPIAQAFGTLERARQRGWTRWSIVYELGPLRAHFRTEHHAAIRRIDLTAFDLACSAPVKMLDVDAQLEGDVAPRFTPYSTAANLDLVKRSFRKTPFLAQTPDSTLEAFGRHPDRARCTAAEVGGAR